MIALVLADSKFGIAKYGKQILYIPEDLVVFRTLTQNAPIVFGRKTMEHFPNGKPLKDRVNICLSKTLETTDDLIVVHDIPKLLELQNITYLPFIVVGGASVYKQLYPYLSTVIVTKVAADFEADQFFPDLEHDEDYVLLDAYPWHAAYVNDKIYNYRYEIYYRRHERCQWKGPTL